VEIKTRADTSDISALQRAADFVQAFILGFDIGDAIALLRLDDLYVESFEVRAGPFDFDFDQLCCEVVWSGYYFH
jgi:rRNA processing protein Krr1/Pno1